MAPAARHAHARELLYGCQDGRVVQLLVDASTVRQGCVIGACVSARQADSPVDVVRALVTWRRISPQPQLLQG